MVSEYVKYVTTTIPRTDLKNAPYNPRTISDYARLKLKANLKRVGLIEPPVWNRRTGNIVGGHQRVAVLDALHGHDNYLLPVAEVDLDEKTEKEQNVFLNNGEAQGDFDLEKLAALYKEGINFDNAGFDQAEVIQMFGSAPASYTDELVDEVSEAIRASQERIQKLAETESLKSPQHFYLVVVFKDDDHRVVFTNALGLPDNRYVDGRRLLALLKPKADEPKSGLPEAHATPEPAGA